MRWRSPAIRCQATAATHQPSTVDCPSPNSHLGKAPNVNGQTNITAFLGMRCHGVNARSRFPQESVARGPGRARVAQSHSKCNTLDPPPPPLPPAGRHGRTACVLPWNEGLLSPVVAQSNPQPLGFENRTSQVSVFDTWPVKACNPNPGLSSSSTPCGRFMNYGQPGFGQGRHEVCWRSHSARLF